MGASQFLATGARVFGAPRRLAVGDTADRAVCVTKTGVAPDTVAQAAEPAVSQVANLRQVSEALAMCPWARSKDNRVHFLPCHADRRDALSFFGSGCAGLGFCGGT